MNALATLLSSQVKAEMFRLLFGVDEGRLHLRELARRSGLGLSTVRKELERLVRLGVVGSEDEGNRTYYSANRNHPLYPGISSLVLKSVGVADVLREALRQADVRVAFISGPAAARPGLLKQELQLVVIGAVAKRELERRLTWAENIAGRELNCWPLTVEQFKTRKRGRDKVLSSVLAARRLFIIGNKQDLRGL